MIIEVKVPSVGESVTSGVVSAWHKKSGEFVNEGEPLFALETDKVSTDIVAEKSGVLETKVTEGQEVKIGEVVAVIDDSKQTSNPGRRKSPKGSPQVWTVAGPSQRLSPQYSRPESAGLWKKRSSNRERSLGRVRAVG
jgi:2-oxoglutarate dehydrogenase E2 component (dihydrolipoamide succinyltransferase)